MTQMTVQSDSLSLKSKSSIAEVGPVIQSVVHYLRDHEVSSSLINQISIVIRELLINAMKHGNGFHSEDSVIVCISSVEHNRFKIEVQDSGDGFDYQKLEMSLPENPREIQNRGFRLVKAYSDSIVFNQKGNKVTAYVSA